MVRRKRILAEKKLQKEQHPKISMSKKRFQNNKKTEKHFIKTKLLKEMVSKLMPNQGKKFLSPRGGYICMSAKSGICYKKKKQINFN